MTDSASNLFFFPPPSVFLIVFLLALYWYWNCCSWHGDIICLSFSFLKSHPVKCYTGCVNIRRGAIKLLFQRRPFYFVFILKFPVFNEFLNRYRWCRVIELSVLHGLKIIAFSHTFFIYSYIFQNKRKKMWRLFCFHLSIFLCEVCASESWAS